MSPDNDAAWVTPDRSDPRHHSAKVQNASTPVMASSPVGEALEPRPPKSAQTVAVSFEGGNNQNGGNRRFQLEVSECVETKTVTTTTRLTRKFPQVFVRDPAPLQTLDSKEYPLALKPTPPELLTFSYNVPDQEPHQVEDVAWEEPDDDYEFIAGKPVCRPWASLYLNSY